jgi:cell division protein FtsW
VPHPPTTNLPNRHSDIAPSAEGVHSSYSGAMASALPPARRSSAVTAARLGLVKGTLDTRLLYLTVLLFFVGLIAVYTATGFMAYREKHHFMFMYVVRQAMAGVLGFALLWVTLRIPFWKWRAWALPLSGVSIGLLLLTWQLGVTANGSERWLPLPFGATFQPSEVAKVAAVMLLANVTSMSGQFWLTLRFLGFMVVLLGMVGLIFIQPNLSISLMLGIISTLMILTAGFPLGIFTMLAVPGTYFLYQKIRHTAYQWQRIVGWLNPLADPQGKGYNLLHSYYAIAGGGIQGVGFGQSIQKLYYLPFHHTDFIFAVWCEEMGLIGGCLLIALFGLFGFCGFSIANRCPNQFGQQLAFGLTLTIVLQAALNMAVTLGLMPVTGVTLPLISYGGSSVVVTLALVGILLNISKYREKVSLNEAA